MKKSAFKLALIAGCFAFTLAACSSNQNEAGNADSDSTLMPTEGMSTDTMMTDTTGMGTGSGTGTDTMGTGTGSGTTPTP